MSRLAVFALAIATSACAACSNSKSKGTENVAPAPTEGGEKIAVPGGEKGAPEGSRGGPTAGAPTEGGAVGAVDNPAFHLKPEEGTLTVGKGEAKAGTPATADVSLAPGAGYKIATDYPTKLTLEAPPGVTLEKAEMTAGGRNKVQGDAKTLSEKSLAFAVKATADKAGSYEIKGVFKFGICEAESCHPKKQPISITVAAN